MLRSRFCCAGKSERTRSTDSMRTTSSDSRSRNAIRTFASGSRDAPKRLFRLRAPYAHPFFFPCSGVRNTTSLSRSRAGNVCRMIASVRSGRMTTAYTARVKLVATIYEETQDAAISSIRSLPSDPDIVEVRLDAFGGHGDFRALRAATSKPIIVTNRGGAPIDADAAIAAGIDLVDVEYDKKVTHPDRTVLSFHDFERVPDLKRLLDAMAAFGCAHTKIAATPQTLRENEELLAALRPGLTIFGMGERGLSSRILAPFFGSELAFVGNAAPGQLPLDRALEIYGDDRRLRKPEKIFAVAGNPAGHSLSPSIHNPLFRKHGVAAAYTIASVESFDEVIEPFTARRLTGMSVTAPFKDDALAFAQRIGAKIGRN